MKNKLKAELLVTKPAKPPLEEFHDYLAMIWDSRWITNGGPIHEEFEKALCDFLGVKYVSVFSSGTMALFTAIRALELTGEVITTAFTSVETAQCIYLNQLEPVFADISQNDLNITAENIESLITNNTAAILPVHVFGNPCMIEDIKILAAKHQLPLIYDAAHCFGVDYEGTSICNFGDLSILSFHATKVFNTIEGGAIISHDKATKDKVDILRNAGKLSGYQLGGYGLNCKLNEVQSAYGLTLLKYADTLISQRKTASERYAFHFRKVDGINVPAVKENVKYNYTYFPIIIDIGIFRVTRDELMLHLEKRNIKTRKYFHPLVSDYPEFNNFKTDGLQSARSVADNIICLPLYHDITVDEQNIVIEAILEISKKKLRRKKVKL